MVAPILTPITTINVRKFVVPLFEGYSELIQVTFWNHTIHSVFYTPRGSVLCGGLRLEAAKHGTTYISVCYGEVFYTFTYSDKYGLLFLIKITHIRGSWVLCSNSVLS